MMRRLFSLIPNNRNLAKALLAHGAFNIWLSWLMLANGYYLAAVLSITWGNFVTWSGLFELNRRNRWR